MSRFHLTGNFRDKKIKLFKKEIEPQEVLLDKLAQKREEELGISKRKLEVPVLNKTLIRFLIFSLLLFTFLFARTFQLKALEGKKFSKLAEQNKFIIYSIRASRGVIYDKSLNQLVFNQPSFDLICKKADLPRSEEERAKVIKKVSSIIKKDFKLLEKEIEDSQKPTIQIAEHLDHRTLIIFEAKKNQLPGFQIKNNTVREYWEGPTFSHIIGYKRKNGEETGLEKTYDQILREKPGKILTERDARGNIISKKIVSLPESGKSIVLWLDSKLQKKTEEELKKELKKIGAKAAGAIALDPKTGGVMALVSIPNFDNNLFSKGRMTKEEWEEIQKNPLNPLLNRVVSGQYPTGSIIKPLIASAVLEEKIISPNKKIYCHGKITIPNPWQRTHPYVFHDWEVHGPTDIRKAIAESCNVYFYTVGGGYKDQKGLGPSRIKKYLKLFGWGEKTGIDLPKETVGFIPDKNWKEKKLGENWWDGDTYNLSIGQGFLRITPLEVASSFLPIANGGKLLKLKLLKEIVDSKKNMIEEIKPEIIRENFIDQKNLQIVKEGMRGSVTYGTSKILNELPVKVAAKTGTAQTSRPGYYHNWITVFAPYEDPKIVLTIFIENVKGMQVTAAPVAKSILEWYFAQPSANF